VGQNSAISPPTVTKFYLVREHRLHGIITGIEGVKIMSSPEDKLDRLLVSFKDAKVRKPELLVGVDCPHLLFD
jgi:cleavage and polyadenylation specificity factor subunit 1